MIGGCTWLAPQRCCTWVNQQVGHVPLIAQDLLAARLPAILRRGQDNAAAYSVAEGYLLHGGE